MQKHNINNRKRLNTSMELSQSSSYKFNSCTWRFFTSSMFFSALSRMQECYVTNDPREGVYTPFSLSKATV